jgi:putative ABC transport system substrate-binding protein
MIRREFITLLGGAAAALPLAVRAQQPGKLPTIGFFGVATALVHSPRTAAFVERLHELGWTEGRSVEIEYRWADGRYERFSEITAEFVRLKVDVIVTTMSGAVVAKKATSIIPIVFYTGTDPISAGLVASLARPDGNVTGLSNQEADLAGKRIELLREVVPSLRRLGIMANPDFAPAALEVGAAQTVAANVGLQVITSTPRRGEDIAPAFDAIRGRVDALYVCGDALQSAHRLRINTLALGLRLPTVLPNREDAEAAGLISYGPNFNNMARRAADYVDKILRGAKPADIPVEQPTKFELVINLTTAKALGVEIPSTLLARADEVIE